MVALPDRLTELSQSNALLATALAELRDKGISNAVADALVGVRVPDADLDEFLALAARDVPQKSVFGLALSLPEYIDRRNAGRDALVHCFARGELTEDQIFFVARNMSEVTSLDAVLWCHRQMVTVVRLDSAYFRFLQRHLTTVVARCPDEMTAYLLHPNRGPVAGNIDSFDLVVRVADDPWPFIRRWQEWIGDGLFDPGSCLNPTDVTAHYAILSERWDEPVFDPVRATTHDYAVGMVRSFDPTRRAAGMSHLTSMILGRYQGAGEVHRRLLNHGQDLPQDEARRLGILKVALAATAESVAAPDDQRLRREADGYRSAVISTSRPGDV